MFPVTRQEAIERQLETAIEMWFLEKDIVSVHTLACSALRIAHDVGKVYGKASALLSKLTPALRNKSLEPQNFFKHADKDPHKVYPFNPEITQHHIFDAVTLYEALYLKPTKLMSIFLIRFALLHPSISSVSGLPASFDKAAFAKMKNKEFFAAISPLVH
jgi:hypothetical protein